MASLLGHRAIEDNIRSFLQIAVGHAPGGRWERSADLLAYRSDIHFPLFNGVLDARIDGDVGARIDEVLAGFERDGMPMLWWVGPSTEPGDLADRLAARGLHREDDPAMVIDLDAVGEPIAPGLEVIRVRGLDGLDAWRAAFEAAFPELAGEVVAAIAAVFEAAGFGGPLRHWVGMLDGEVAACATLCLGGEVAGIYNIGTVPAARGRGIGTAMTVVALREGARLGARVGALQSSRMGLGVYRGLGFRDVGTISTLVRP